LYIGTPSTDHVGGLDLGNQRVVQRDPSGLHGGSLLGRREQRAERDVIQDRVRSAVQVAHGQPGFGIRIAEPRHDAIGKTSGVRGFAASARIDLQDVHGRLLRRGLAG
jgi:hypothetical protein